MSSLSRLAAATLISSTLLAPGLAAADDRHEDRDGRHEQARPSDRDGRHATPPAFAGHDGARWEGRGPAPEAWRREALRERRERERRLEGLRVELRQLERQHAVERARLAWDRRRLARCDERFELRRAHLVRAIDELAWLLRPVRYAWR